MKTANIFGIDYDVKKGEDGSMLFTLMKEKEVDLEPINVPAETIKPYKQPEEPHFNDVFGLLDKNEETSETKEEVVVDPILEQLGLDDADAKDVVEPKEEPENEPEEDYDEDEDADDNDESGTELVACKLMVTKGVQEYFNHLTHEAKKQAKIVPPPTKLKKEVYLGQLVAEKFNTQALEHFRLKSKANV